MGARIPLYYVLVIDVAGGPYIAPYGKYGALSVYTSRTRAEARARRVAKHHHAVRVLPWHSEMGEVDLDELWASALAIG